MKISRFAPACVTLPSSVIMVMGGFGMSDEHSGHLKSAELFDPLTNSWSEGVPMPTSRTNFAAVCLGDFVYAIGGYNGGDLSSCNRFDLSTSHWSFFSNMHKGGPGLRAVTLLLHV